MDSDEIHQHLAVRNDRTSKFFIIFAGVAFLIGAIFAVAAWSAATEQQAWAPLGEFKIPQRVTNGPVIKLGDTVNTIATKCYKETVRTRSSQVWQTTDAKTVVLPIPLKVNLQEKGCKTRRYYNRIPADVAALVRAGVTGPWILAGTQTPYDSGRQGEPRTWETDSFRLVP